MTLLALLELVRLGQARARQAELFGDIVIERGADELTVQRARSLHGETRRSTLGRDRRDEARRS